MSEEIKENITNPVAIPIATRSVLYSTFAAAWEYPDLDMLEAIRSGAVVGKFKELLAVVNPDLISKVDWAALMEGGKDDEEMMVEFTRLFDAGAAGPPCALYGGLYLGARMKIMEEAVRFYNHFGLSMSETPHELPDHITTQLEFLHFLSFQEARLVDSGEDPSDFQRAQRDFIARHIGRWLPRMIVKLDQQKPLPFFQELTKMLNAFLVAELDRLVGLVGKVNKDGDSDVVRMVEI